MLGIYIQNRPRPITFHPDIALIYMLEIPTAGRYMHDSIMRIRPMAVVPAVLKGRNRTRTVSQFGGAENYAILFSPRPMVPLVCSQHSQGATVGKASENQFEVLKLTAGKPAFQGVHNPLGAGTPDTVKASVDTEAATFHRLYCGGNRQKVMEPIPEAVGTLEHAINTATNRINMFLHIHVKSDRGIPMVGMNLFKHLPRGLDFIPSTGHK